MASMHDCEPLGESDSGEMRLSSGQAQVVGDEYGAEQAPEQKLRYACSICGYSCLKSRQWIVRHIETSHPDSPAATVLKVTPKQPEPGGDTCAPPLLAADAPHRHHNVVVYQCNICGFRGKSQHSVDVHMQRSRNAKHRQFALQHAALPSPAAPAVSVLVDYRWLWTNVATHRLCLAAAADLTCFAYDHLCDRLLCGCFDGTLHVNSLADGQCCVINALTTPVHRVGVLAEKSVVALCGTGSGDVTLLPLSTDAAQLSEAVCGCAVQAALHSAPVRDLALSAHDACLHTVSDDRSFAVTDLATAKLLRRFADHSNASPLTALALAPHSPLAAAASADSRLKFCDTRIAHFLFHFDCTPWHRIASLAFNPRNSMQLVTVGGSVVNLWDLRNRLKLVHSVPIPDFDAKNFSFSHSSNLIAVCGSSLRLFLTDNLQQTACLTNDDDLLGAYFSNDGSRLLCAAPNGCLTMYTNLNT